MPEIGSEEKAGFAATFGNESPVRTAGQASIFDAVIVNQQIHIIFRDGAEIDALAPSTLAQVLSADLGIEPVHRSPVIRIAHYVAVHGVLRNLRQQKAGLAHFL